MCSFDLYRFPVPEDVILRDENGVPITIEDKYTWEFNLDITEIRIHADSDLFKRLFKDVEDEHGRYWDL